MDLASDQQPDNGLGHLGRFPPSVRLRIYRFALVEKRRWNKTHSRTCPYRSQDAKDLEVPPFLLTKVMINGGETGSWDVQTETRCTCAKRAGLSLLRTSKAIHHDASSVFWSNNTFCFLDALDFLATVGHTLRPDFRNQIRVISIMNPDDEGCSKDVSMVGPGSWSMADFWATMKNCRDLHSVDLPAQYIESCPGSATSYVDQLKEAMPENVEKLRLNFLLPLSSKYHRCGYPRPWLAPKDQDTVYVKCSRRISLQQMEWAGLSIRDLSHELQSKFRIHVNTAVKIQYLGARVENMKIFRNTFQLAKGLDTQSCSRCITLPTGEQTTVRFYGLPITNRTNRTIRRRKFAFDRSREPNNNGLTPSQSKVLEKDRRNRKEKRNNTLLLEAKEHDKLLSVRSIRRQQLVIKEKEEAKQASQKRREMIRCAKRGTAEYRRCERKRVAHVSHH